MDDDFRRSGRLLLDVDGDLWSVCPETGDRDYLGAILDGLTSHEVEPAELPIVELWAADWRDSLVDLRGEVRHGYLYTRV